MAEYTEAKAALQQGLNHYRKFANAQAAIQALETIDADTVVLKKARDTAQQDLERERQAYGAKTAQLEADYQARSQELTRQIAVLTQEYEEWESMQQAAQAALENFNAQAAETMQLAERQHAAQRIRLAGEQADAEHELATLRQTIQAERDEAEQTRATLRKQLERVIGRQPAGDVA